MLHFTNTQLATKHHISLGTVRNWIEASKDGKINLELYEGKDRTYIANTPTNTNKIKRLVAERRKYRNSNAIKKITPKPRFYELFKEEDIHDILTSIEVNKEIPLQYNYYDVGAKSWSEYVEKIEHQEHDNSFHSAQEMLRASKSTFDYLLSKYKRINIVDIGCGNSMPARSVLKRLLEEGKLGRYIAIDISQEMLNIAKRNVDGWFDGEVQFEGYRRNISQERFADLLIPEYHSGSNKETVNVVLLLGYTLHNMKRPESGYRSIYDSMGKDDLLIEDIKLDSEVSRGYFDFDADPGQSKLSPLNAIVFELMNIDPSCYNVELGFDEKRMQRFEQIRFKVAVEIDVKFGEGTRVIELNKGDTILMWRVLHMSCDDVLRQKSNMDFSVMHSLQTVDNLYMLTISRVKQRVK